MEKYENRQITARGKRGSATLLPLQFMEKNELYRGSPLVMATSPDKKRLYVCPRGSKINFTTEFLKIYNKDYTLGVRVLKRGKKSYGYPIITLPNEFLHANDLGPTKGITIWKTSQDSVLMITKKKE